jgi:hypothetical protein
MKEWIIKILSWTTNLMDVFCLVFNLLVIVYFIYLWNFHVFSGQTPSGRPPTSFPTTQTLSKCSCFSLLLCFKVVSRSHQCLVQGHYKWLSHPIAVGVGDVVECAASLITWVRLVAPIGGATGGSGNLSTSLFNVARLAAHPKFVWVFNANCAGTIIYYDPV